MYLKLKFVGDKYLYDYLYIYIYFSRLFILWYSLLRITFTNKLHLQIIICYLIVVIFVYLKKNYPSLINLNFVILLNEISKLVNLLGLNRIKYFLT